MSRPNRCPNLLLSASAGLALTMAAYAWLAVSGGAMAGEPRPTAEQRSACAEDFKRLCPGTRPGGGRVKQCFADHQAELSPLCSSAFGEQPASEG